MKRKSEKKHWDDFWADSQQLSDVYGTDDRIVRNLAGVVELKGARVLEVGAGTGRDAGAMAALGATSHALDYSEESLGLMRGALGDNVEIICGDALALPFAAGSFDVVYHQGLLEHFRAPGKLLDENVRVLKTGGVLLVDVPQKFHYYTGLKHILMLAGRWFAGWETEFSISQLKRMAEKNNLEVVHIYGEWMYPSLFYRIFREAFMKLKINLKEI